MDFILIIYIIVIIFSRTCTMHTTIYINLHFFYCLFSTDLSLNKPEDKKIIADLDKSMFNG